MKINFPVALESHRTQFFSSNLKLDDDDEEEEEDEEEEDTSDEEFELARQDRLAKQYEMQKQQAMWVVYFFLIFF